MDIHVSEETYKFYASTDTEWRMQAGHLLTVGDFKFGIAPTSEMIYVTELTSGALMGKYKIDVLDIALTSTKEDAVRWFANVIGESVKDSLKKIDDIEQKIKKFKREGIERLGVMPKIEKLKL